LPHEAEKRSRQASLIACGASPDEGASRNRLILLYMVLL
jgi:hypothetical protein